MLSLTAATTATIGFSMFAPIATDQGYEVQKYVSPIAVKLQHGFGSHQSGWGFDLSIGHLKGTGFGYRYDWGASYYADDYGDYGSGWSTREGGEVEIIPFFNYYTTSMHDNKGSQTLHGISLGDPFNNMMYENDTQMPMSGFFGNLPGMQQLDGGDRWRTASFRIRTGFNDVGMNLHTGSQTSWDTENGVNYFTGGDIDDPNQRAGILYTSFGSLRLGWDAEGIRHFFQNRLAHDQFFTVNPPGSGYPWVRTIPGRHRFYWYFGNNGGNTLW
jgi:hypothetical protein